MKSIPEIPTNRFLTPAEVARLLTLHEYTVTRLAREGRIGGAFKAGGNWRFRSTALRQWIIRGGDVTAHVNSGNRRRRARHGKIH